MPVPDAGMPLPARRKPGILRAMRRTLPFLLLLAACGTPAGTEGRWSGTMQPAQGVPGCRAGKAGLTATRGSVLFTPDEGTWTLQGTITPSGAIAAERTTISANKTPYQTLLSVQLDGARITGTYTTPKCSYAVTMSRS